MNNMLRIPLIGLVVLCLAAAGCAHRPQPDNIGDICAIFEQYPRWYDYAKRSEKKWGTPIAIQMAFVHQESSFLAAVRPPRRRLLGFIPWKRISSAYGYAQAQDPVWGEYLDDAARLDAHRTRMQDALDFIGWYNNLSHERLGIAKDNARHLYLAYHEGHGGYRRRTYQEKPSLQRVARKVERRSAEYSRQLQTCEDELRCWKWYQFWPFCS